MSPLREHLRFRRAKAPSVLGNNAVERVRRGSFALLGLTAVVGLGLLAFVSSQEWPVVPGSAIPSAPEATSALRHGVVGRSAATGSRSYRAARPAPSGGKRPRSSGGHRSGGVAPHSSGSLDAEAVAAPVAVSPPPARKQPVAHGGQQPAAAQPAVQGGSSAEQAAPLTPKSVPSSESGAGSEPESRLAEGQGQGGVNGRAKGWGHAEASASPPGLSGDQGPGSFEGTDASNPPSTTDGPGNGNGHGWGRAGG